MIRVGTDIVEISRFSDMEKREIFKKRFFTAREREYFDSLGNPWQSVAGAFAAKEAFSKYIGTGFGRFELKDIEILHDDRGKPYIEFFGSSVNADVSISHSKSYAVAVVCGEEMQLDKCDTKTLREYKNLLPKRYDNMHKGDCGRVLVVAGSKGFVGAACLCSEACIRCGSGLITLALPEEIQPYASVKLTEVMTCPLECAGGTVAKAALPTVVERLEKSDACAIGPGIGKSEGVKAIVKEILRGKTPCVIDADALNVIAEDLSVLKHRECDVVMTPHPGEMARLTGLPIKEIEESREEIASEFAKRYGVTLLLKGHNTVIASETGEIKVNVSGNSGMASGGMGDVLTGVIASFVGQGLSGFNAAVLGAYIHGRAGDAAADEIGRHGMIASDVLSKLPGVIKYLDRYIK